MILFACLAVGAYALGSVSTAIIVSRALGLSDPRDVGSGNPGATNVLRYAGKKAAAVTLLGDALKGVLPVIAGAALGLEAPLLTAVGAAAFLGHLFPIYYGFSGGKGVATFIGVNLALNLWVGLGFVATWLLVAFALRYSSLAALVATALTPALAWFFGEPPLALALYAAMAVLIFVRHRGNIAKLIAGEEKKIGQRA
ncbi:MAG: glycerol-3-phosphate 1-O-acyltransferase PlsY [Gammaproteobacteria bacterium]